MSKLKELYYWLKAQITLDNTHFTDLEDLQHENNELRTTVDLLQQENREIKLELSMIRHNFNNNFDKSVLDDFSSALHDFLQLTGQSDTSQMLTNELRKSAEVEVIIAGREVNRKKIKQAFGNFERYMTIDIVEKGLYYSLIFKKR